MITQTQRHNILYIINSMPVGEVKWMKDFFPGEVDFIINAIKHQRYDKEWSIELNNNFTKFRKCKLIK